MFSDVASTNQAVPVRRWTAVASFTLQAALIAAAMTYPLLHPESLPVVLHPLFVPVLGHAGPVQHETEAVRSHGTVIRDPIVVNQHSVWFGHSSPQPAGTGLPEAPNIGILGSGDPNGVLGAISGDYMRPLPTTAIQTRNVRRSVVMEGHLMHKVEPQY